MNFETKYLIKWGIPGWIFIVGMLPLMFLSGLFTSKTIGELNNFIEYITLIISLITLGIPIGYIFQRSSFLTTWILKGKKRYFREKQIITRFTGDVPKPSWWGIKNEVNNYFYIEYQFQYNLSKLENDRLTYLSHRYAHILSTAHSMATVAEVTSISCGFYLSFTIVAFLFDEFFIIEKAWIVLLACSVVHFTIAYIFLKNYKYFSENALYFQTNLLNDIYLENKSKEISNENQNNNS